MNHFKLFLPKLSGRASSEGAAAAHSSHFKETQADEESADTFPAPLDEMHAFRAFMPTAAADLSDS